MFKFGFLPLASIFLLFFGCQSSLNKPVNEENNVKFNFTPDLERSFLIQIVFSKKDFDGLIICEQAKDIGFQDVNLITQGLISMIKVSNGLDTNSLKQKFSNNYTIRVGDSDLIRIYQQFLLNNISPWNAENTGGRKIMTKQQDQDFLNELGNKLEPDSLSIIQNQLHVKGRLDMSHPIFFNNNKMALFTYSISIGHHEQKEECNLYWKNPQGQWILQNTLLSKLRLPKTFHYK